MAREDARPSWASKPLRSPAERRRARKWAATSAENAIWRLTAQLKEAKAAALAASDPQVRARLDASVPALAKLCHGMPVRGAERLRRNVAWHSAELPSPSAPLSAWRAAQRGPRLEHREMLCSDLDAGDDGGPRPQLSEVSCSGAPHSLSLDAMPYLPLALRPADAAHLFVLKTVLTDILAPLAGACALVPDAEAEQCALVQRLAEALEVSRRLPADCDDPSAHLAADVGAEYVPASEDGLLTVQSGLFCSPASAEPTDEDGQLSEQDSLFSFFDSLFVQPADTLNLTEIWGARKKERKDMDYRCLIKRNCKICRPSVWRARSPIPASNPQMHNQFPHGEHLEKECEESKSPNHQP